MKKRPLVNGGEYTISAKIVGIEESTEESLERVKRVKIDKDEPSIEISLDNEVRTSGKITFTVKAKDEGGSKLKEIKYKSENEEEYKIIEINNTDINELGEVTISKQVVAQNEPYNLQILVEDNAGNTVQGEIKIPKLPLFIGVDTNITDPESAMPEGLTELNIVENNLKEGIVIKDNNENEWTWVEVPKNVTENATNEIEIESALKSYAEPYSSVIPEDSTKSEDKYYEGCGFNSESEYNNQKNKMLNSIKNNGGFWISRYEIGDNTATLSNTPRYSSTGIIGLPVSKANQIPYNYVTTSEAQTLASSINVEDKKGCLLFGIQMELVCKFLEKELSISAINEDSTPVGNYKNSSLILEQGKYNPNPSNSRNESEWIDYNIDKENIVIGSTTQQSNNATLLTTGASSQTKIMNIYDIAGNLWEKTLECIDDYYCTIIGGSNANDNNEIKVPISFKTWSDTDFKNAAQGFRVSIY